MTPDNERLWQKLRQLVTYDPGMTVFGSKSHKYRIYPCLAEEEVEGFERQYGVALPADYRSFLMEIANGGVGPNYGLRRLQDSVDADSLGLLSRPFPHREEWNLSHAQFACVQDFDEEYFRGEHRQGALSISDIGCGHSVLLVVSGEERGTVWQDYRAADGGIVPVRDARTGSVRTTFAGWYEAWLDTSLTS